jgi:hypothetical protein
MIAHTSSALRVCSVQSACTATIRGTNSIVDSRRSIRRFLQRLVVRGKQMLLVRKAALLATQLVLCALIFAVSVRALCRAALFLLPRDAGDQITEMAWEKLGIRPMFVFTSSDTEIAAERDAKTVKDWEDYCAAHAVDYHAPTTVIDINAPNTSSYVNCAAFFQIDWMRFAAAWRSDSYPIRHASNSRRIASMPG